jgi:hypothetical protein
MAETTMHTQITMDRPASRDTSRDAATPKRSPRRDERVEFGALFALCFLMVLPAVISRRALAACGIASPTAGPAKSVLREAREAARSTVPYAFMG